MNIHTKAEESFLRQFKEHDLPVQFLGWLEVFGYFTAQASRSHHGDWPGGLLEHSLAVVDFLKQYGHNWRRPASPFIIGAFHDLCKLNVEHHIPGHGQRSVELLKLQMSITKEEEACIRWHMGAYEGPQVWDALGDAIELSQNVLWTHTADMYAAKVLGI